MKILIDTDRQTITCEADGDAWSVGLYTPRGFEILSDQWLKVGWAQHYSYSFTWLGRPVIQLPEDVIRLQELIYRVQPDVIVETGIAHGGSLIFYASLCKLLGRGLVVGVDIEIRPHNRSAIEAHPLFPYISLIEGDSVDPHTVQKVKELIQPHDTVLVVLDSNHAKAHVLAELEAYAPSVTPGSFVVVMDGMMEAFQSVPGASSDWEWNNPRQAVATFVQQHPNYQVEAPEPLFNESELTPQISYCRSGYLKRIT